MYGWWYYPPWWVYAAYFNPWALADLLYLMMVPYYWMLYFELFRSLIEAWRRSFESMFKPGSTS